MNSPPGFFYVLLVSERHFISPSRHEFKGRAYGRPPTWEELVRQYEQYEQESEYWEKASRTQYRVKKKRYILHTSIDPTSPLLWFFGLVLAYSLIFSNDTTSELNQDITAFMSPSEKAKAKRDFLGKIDQRINQKRPWMAIKPMDVYFKYDAPLGRQP